MRRLMPLFLIMTAFLTQFGGKRVFSAPIVLHLALKSTIEHRSKDAGKCDQIVSMCMCSALASINDRLGFSLLTRSIDLAAVAWHNAIITHS